MNNFLYILVFLSALSGIGLYFDIKREEVEIAHYIGGFTLLSVLILFTSDHLIIYKRYLWKVNFPFLSGTFLIVISCITFFTGLTLFLYEAGEIPQVLYLHQIFSILFVLSFLTHLLKKKRKK